MDDNTGNSPAVTPAVQEEEISYQEIHENTPTELAQPKEEVVEDKSAEETKPEEIKPEPSKEEPIDPKKLVEDISNSVMEKLEANKETKDKVTEEVKDEYERFTEQIQEKEGRPPTWKEALDFVKEEAIKQIKLEQEEVAKAAEAKVEEERKVNEALVKKVNSMVDEEIDELYARNELTPIKDKKNASDQGVVERKALFQKMLEVNQERQSKGLDPIMSIQRIYYGYYKRPSAQPAGENAPVSMGKGSVQARDTEELDYVKDVRGNTWGKLKAMVQK